MEDIQLQYISQGKTVDDHIENIENACKSGVKWIQLRLKNVDHATYLTKALECRTICDRYEAIMIVNDNVDIAKASNADGIHLGLQDMNPKVARKLLGENSIIGGTANTYKDCIQQINDGVDYIGLGPFRFTETKDKLSPVLGTEGYESILSELKKGNPDHVPVIAIGGIQRDDIPDILNSGVSGIAASGMLSDTGELKEKVKNIKELIGLSD